MQQGNKEKIFLSGAIFLCAVILAAAVSFLIFYRKETWADHYIESLKYNFDDTAVNMKMKKKEWRKEISEIFHGAYDFDKDGQAEPVQISFSDGEAGRIMEIAYDGGEALQISLEPLDVQRAVTVVGIRYKADAYLAVLESVYDSEAGMGKLQWEIYRYQDGVFVKEEALLYSGTADGHGIMTEGVLESRSAKRTFVYDVKQDQNDYIYCRSVIFADMKELGISLPVVTTGWFETAYKRNVKGIFNVIVE